MAGMRVSDAQLTSSRKRMPSGMPLFSTASYAAAMILCAMYGRPSALWRVWCVME